MSVFALEEKKETVNDMFVFYDRDGSRLLNSSELDQVEHRDHLDRLSRSCHLTDFIGYSDTDADEIITLSEFYNAYGTKIQEIYLSSLYIWTPVLGG